jgi:hypothetical protein
VLAHVVSLAQLLEVNAAALRLQATHNTASADSNLKSTAAYNVMGAVQQNADAGVATLACC